MQRPKNFWENGNFVIVMVAGGVTLGGAIAHTPGVIIGGAIALVFAVWYLNKKTRR